RCIVERLEDCRLAGAEVKDGHFDSTRADPSYAAAFREYGLDVDRLTPAEAAARIRERPRPIRDQLAAALDDWAAIRRAKGNNTGSQRLLEIARRADPDRRRNRLRDALAQKRVQALKAIAAEKEVADLPPPTLVLLGDALARLGALSDAE